MSLLHARKWDFRPWQAAPRRPYTKWCIRYPSAFGGTGLRVRLEPMAGTEAHTVSRLRHSADQAASRLRHSADQAVSRLRHSADQAVSRLRHSADRPTKQGECSPDLLDTLLTGSSGKSGEGFSSRWGGPPCP